MPLFLIPIAAAGYVYYERKRKEVEEEGSDEQDDDDQQVDVVTEEPGRANKRAMLPDMQMSTVSNDDDKKRQVSSDEGDGMDTSESSFSRSDNVDDAQPVCKTSQFPDVDGPLARFRQFLRDRAESTRSQQDPYRVMTHDNVSQPLSDTKMRNFHSPRFPSNETVA